MLCAILRPIWSSVAASDAKQKDGIVSVRELLEYVESQLLALSTHMPRYPRSSEDRLVSSLDRWVYALRHEFGFLELVSYQIILRRPLLRRPALLSPCPERGARRVKVARLAVS